MAVGATLRVVRTSSCTPSLSSSFLTIWLNPDCVSPSLPAALVKLRSRATWTKAVMSLSVSRAIDYNPYSVSENSAV
jgi:hypothetical protein